MDEALQFAIESGMINLSYIQDKYEMNKRAELLSKHKWAISQGKDGYWRTYLPDEKNRRKMVKRKTQKDIENLVIKYICSQEENDKIKKTRLFSKTCTENGLYQKKNIRIHLLT